METSSFLFENLPYSILIWLHFGTNLLISFSYVFYVFPILFNIIVIVLPHFNFGFMKQKAGGSGSGATIIPADLNNTLKDSKVFAHAYSRNPKLFSSLPIQEVGTFFSGLDEKLSGISTALKGFPVADESIKAKTSDINSTTGSASAGDDISSDSSNNNVENLSEEAPADTKDKKSKKKKDVKEKKKDSGEKSSKSSIKNFLVYGNLVFLIAIIGINAYGYFHYNSLFNDYFIAKKGMFKYSNENYELDYKKVRTLKDTVKTQILKDISNYVQMINSVKSDKLRRQKLEEQEEQEKNIKK